MILKFKIEKTDENIEMLRSFIIRKCGYIPQHMINLLDNKFWYFDYTTKTLDIALPSSCTYTFINAKKWDAKDFTEIGNIKVIATNYNKDFIYSTDEVLKIVDRDNNVIIVTDLTKAISDVKEYTTYVDETNEEFTKERNEYWTDMLKKLRKLKARVNKKLNNHN